MTPFRGRGGARAYLVFVYGRFAAFAVAAAMLIAASVFSGERAFFGGAFLATFALVFVASVGAVAAGAIGVVGSGISERLSSFFTLRYVGDAAALLGVDPRRARQRALVGVIVAVLTIIVGVIVTALAFG